MNGDRKKSSEDLSVLEMTNIQESYTSTHVQKHILFNLSFNLEVLFTLIISTVLIL